MVQREDEGESKHEKQVAETCEEEFVPEPGTMLLTISGLAGLFGFRKRFRKR